MDILVAHLSGPASLKFLHDVSAQDVASLSQGSGALASFLDERGRVLAFGRVLAGEDEAFVLVDPACADGLERAVTRVAPLAGVDVDVRTLPSCRVAGDGDPYSWRRDGESIVVMPGWGEVGAQFIGRVAEPHLDAAAIEDARIAGGLPRFGTDITAETLVNETPLLTHAVSLSKGCFPGQESVARVFNLGQVKRKLRVVEIIDGTLNPGSEDLAVTSSAGSLALAWVPIELEPGTEIVTGAARIMVTDAGW